jgi:arylsulfatase A-like enzyme/Tfp pilus assembly protein PilF
VKSRGALRIVLAIAFLGLASVIALSGRPQPAAAEAGQDKPNVILVTIDTLRADRVRSYGYAGVETPHVDALAREGVRFTHAYTPVPITLPAHTSLFTGAFPMATGVHDFVGNKLPAGTATLAGTLRDHGYTTAAFIASAVLDSRFGLNRGFDTYFDHFDFGHLQEAQFDQMERRGDLVMDEALSWLRRNPRQPFFLWVHLYDPHHPYSPPEPYASRYHPEPYDGEVAFADAQVGRLLAYLRERKLYEDALVVLASDHGEGLGEHGEKTHGFFIYNSTLHVPLIIRVPGMTPRVVEEEVSLVDVMPTVLQALKLPNPASVQGRSLMSAMLGRPPGSPSNLYAETYEPLLHFHWSQLRALQSRGWKFIEAPKAELYDLRSDPGERKNLFANQGARAHEMRERLYGVMRRYTPAGGPEPEKALTDPALYDKLRSLGYVAVSAGTYAPASGKRLVDPKDRIQVYELISEAMLDGQRGQQQESLRKLREAAMTEPDSPTINYMMALNYQRLRDYPKAFDRFRAALQANPNFSAALFSLGLTQLESGDLKGAAESLARVVDIDPTHFSAAFNLGIVHLKSSRFDEAFREFQRTVAINPDFAPARAALGEGYLQQGKPAEAVRELERSLQLDPSSRRARYSLSRAYQALGRTAEAEREFNRANTPQ